MPSVGTQLRSVGSIIHASQMMPRVLYNLAENCPTCS